MNRIELDSGVILEYEHVPIIASSNPIIGAKYFTKLYLVNSNGNKYPLGEWDAKLDEDEVKLRFIELISVNQERQYGTQRPMLRRELPRLSKGTTNRGISGSILNR
jgi:hypothetical protein